MRTVDGGATWTALTVPDAAELDFRDVEALRRRHGRDRHRRPAGANLRTENGGASFERVYEHPHPDAFFDAMDFWDAERGLIMSDPVDGRFVVLATADGGRTWSALETPEALAGEAGFAASGSNLAVGPGELAWIGTGGLAARMLRTEDGGASWSVAETPLRSGEPSTGVFSVAFRDAQHGFAVGGDYQDPPNPEGNHARSEDGGLSWTTVAQPPGGYRSCVVFVPGRAAPTWVAVGRAGTDVSFDDGVTWTAIGDEGYYAASVGTHGGVWAAGAEGRVARLEWGH